MSSIAVKDNSKTTPTSLVDIFQSINRESCPYRYNFHLHTRCSDGQLQPEALMEQAMHLGLIELAITDHHSVKGYLLASQWLGQQSLDRTLPNLWPGLEITASLLETDVHILAYDFEIGAPELQPYLQGQKVKDTLGQAAYVIEAIHQAKGLAVLAHPARYKKSAEKLAAAAVELGIDGLETYYCYSSTASWSPSPAQTQLMLQLSEQYDLLQTCGTDTHGLNIQRRR